MLGSVLCVSDYTAASREGYHIGGAICQPMELYASPTYEEYRSSCHNDPDILRDYDTTGKRRLTQLYYITWVNSNGYFSIVVCANCLSSDTFINSRYCLLISKQLGFNAQIQFILWHFHSNKKIKLISRNYSILWLKTSTLGGVHQISHRCD